MIRFFRAASFAAATFVFVFGAPSLAWELTGSPLPTVLAEPAAEISGPVGAPPPAASAPPVAAADPAPAAEPEKPAPSSLDELVDRHASARTADAQHECLAGAVYFESKGEPLRGQLSVAEVILNRARSGRFPASVCGVVKQRGQFSFVRSGRIPAVARASLAWKRAVAIAHIAREKLADGGAPRALFFHARYVSPRWRLTRVAAVGNHIFYR
ncbi:MAG TPA: cell wall hydrolase [Allosphingosinicella sp.]|jgi:spore germination cell wall hydrolase CwlJ-like protein